MILLVDSNDGVQAQTVANFYLAFGSDLVIIPVLNKIDLKNADPDRVTKQLESLFDMDPKEVLRVDTVCEKLCKIRFLPFPKLSNFQAALLTQADKIMLLYQVL